MFHRILIANRGEIACRIIKTAHRMGIETVAVYSSVDRNNLHVQQANHALCIGEAAATKSYLNIKAIIAAAIESGAQAIHPGYGFLSENPQFAQACEQAGIIFIGPSVSAMEAMASKQLAKQLLEKTGVPLTPGYHGQDQSERALLQQAKKIGFPVLLKAAAGGGGKGMRSVNHEQDFLEALQGARREAQASFSDDTMLIEKLIMNPRHVELQIMADHHGQVIHLFERDCSVQRRHQKIIEEAPAPHVSSTLKQKLADAAITVAREIQYRGAGTVEFLVDGEQFYFMEMNTRLQVEHPVTEMITGLDLVEWQLRIAAGESLPMAQQEITAKGHAIECRIYAEDPEQNFIPSIGKIRFLHEPAAEGIRIDTGIARHSEITMYYDPMIAKLIAFGQDRTQALERMKLALKDYHIGGVQTNLTFLQAIISHQDFITAALNTNFLNQVNLVLPKPKLEQRLIWAAAADYLACQPEEHDRLNAETFAWHMNLKSQWRVQYVVDDQAYSVTIHPIDQNHLTIQFNHQSFHLYAKQTGCHLFLEYGQKNQKIMMESLAEKMVFYSEMAPVSVERFNWQSVFSEQTGADARIVAPMPATVVAVLKNKGDTIKAGDRIMVLEAMKMEHTILAPRDGLLTDIFYSTGAQVVGGAELATLETEVYCTQ